MIQLFARTLTKKVPLIALGGVLSLTLAACGGGDSDDGDSNGDSGATSALDKYKKAGSLKLGVAAEPPYSYLEADGTVAGIDAEVAAAVFAKLGVPKVNGVQVTFSAMIPSLQAKRFDVLAGDLFMKQSRCEVLEFSEPTTVVTYSFLHKDSLDTELTTLEAFAKNKDLKLAVISGTLQSAAAEALGMSGDRLIQVASGRDQVEAMKQNRADAVLDGQVALEAIVGDDMDGLEFSETVPDMPVTGAGVAFRKEDVALRDAFNVEYAKLKESGEYAKLSEKYGLDPEPVLKATMEQLCKTEG